MDETSELFQLCGPGLEALFGAAHGLESRRSVCGVLVLTGEPLPDFNLLLVGSDAGAEVFLQEGVLRAASRGLPLMVVMTPAVEESLVSAAEGLGLAPAGTLPLMVLREPAQPGAKREEIEIKYVSDGVAARVAGKLISRAFSLPAAAVTRVLEQSMGLSGGPEVYLAYLKDKPISAVSITLSDETAAVWSMATDHEHRGRGVGRGLLADVISRLQARGIARIFLFASKEGHRLYESMGFMTLCECPTWVLPSADRSDAG